MAVPQFSTKQLKRQPTHTGVSEDRGGENVQVVDDGRLEPTLFLVTPF